MKNNYNFSHLLPATGASISDSFSPASIGRLWDPENAQKNHTTRNIRFSETYSNTRWNQGIADNFNLQSKSFIEVINYFI